MRRIILFILLFTFIAIQQSFAVTKTFTGAGNWNNNNFWTPNGIPGSADDVIIPSGKTPTVNTNGAICRTLTVQSGGTLTIGKNKDLTISNTNGLTIAGTLDQNGGTITITNNNTSFTISAGGKVIWDPETNDVANATLFTKCIENFDATSTLDIEKWYDLNIGLGSVITGNLGNLSIKGISGWQMKNTLQACSVQGALSLTSSYVILDNTGAISNTTIGSILLNNSGAYLDFHSGTHPGSFIVNSGDVTIDGGELNCFSNSGTGTCTYNLNGSLSLEDQGIFRGANEHNGTITVNISGNATLNKSYFYGVYMGSGNSTINISGNLTTQKNANRFSEFYGVVDGNGTSIVNITGNFSNEGYFDLIWNTGFTGIGNGNCSLTVGGTFSQNDGDFRGIWNATTTNSGTCTLTFGSIDFTGGVFMMAYTCSEAGVTHTLVVNGTTTIDFSGNNDIFRGNGIAQLNSTQNLSECSMTFNGATSIEGNNNGEFISSAGYGNETVLFGSTVSISKGVVYFGFSNHNVTITVTGNFSVSGGTTYFSYTSGTATLNFLGNMTISGGTTNLKNNTGTTSASVNGDFLMSSGVFRLYGNNSVNNTDSISLRTYDDFSHSGGSIQFSSNSNSTGSKNLFIYGANYNISGNGNIISTGAGSSTNFGGIFFGNSTNTNYNRTSNNHDILQVKYTVMANSHVTILAGPMEIASHAAAATDFLTVSSTGSLNAGTNSIRSNGYSNNSGMRVLANGTLYTANINGIFDGSNDATIASFRNMNYSLDAASTVVYNGSDNQRVSGFGNGIATGTQHQYGNLTVDFSGTANSEYVYLERNTILRGALSALNGELRLNSFMLTAETASGSGVGYVKSEENLAVNPSKLRIGYTPANKNLVFPFGRTSTEVIYLNLNITNNPGSGYITISTRRAAANNTPLPGADNVNAITNINPGGPDVSVTHVIDRWWEVNAPGVTADYVLRYSGAENSTPGPTANGTFNVQFWNGGNWTKFNSTGNGVTTGVGIISASLTNINGPIVLSSGSASLPIRVIQFDAKVAGESVEITWTTEEEEKNNDFFSIERSEDGQNFEKIDEINSTGISNQIIKYKTMDDQPLPGVSYYRLKQTNFEGKSTYSWLRSINRGTTTISNDPAIEVRSLGPNPFSDQFNVEYKLTQAGETSIMIFNMNGQVVFETSKQDDEGTNSFLYTDDKNLPPANYILQIINGTEKVTKKIVKR